MFKSKINKYTRLKEQFIKNESNNENNNSNINYVEALKNIIIIVPHNITHSIPSNFTFNLILSKYFELYDKEKLDNFPTSYHVYINVNLNPWDIKYKYNLKLCKKQHKVKSIEDVYKIFYSIIFKN